MPDPRELGFEQCTRLLRGGVAGRVAVCTPEGPHIVPINYSVVGESVVFRTTPYSVLGTYGRDNVIAFELDHFDYDRHEGWSVVVRGRAEVVSDPDEVREIKAEWEPRPWAGGTRTVYIRLPWVEISGRRIGESVTTPVNRLLTGL